MDVVGEKEALQQFFNGQDVSIVFDSAVDTSILEQYLSNETDPTFMLPESPPDSGSERSSPPQLPGSGWSVEQNSEHSSPACIMESWKPDCFGPGGHVTYNAYVSQLHSTAGSSVYGATSCPAQEHRQHSRQEASVISAASSSPSVSAALQPETLYPHARQQHLSDGLHEQKKRRRSNTYDGTTGQDSSAWAKPAFCPESETCEPHSYDSDGGSLASGAHQLLTWERFQHGNWSSLCNSRFETLPPPGFHVDTDKGFTYSAADDAFVCQKKNHFQVTVHIGMVGDPKHVTTPAGPMPVQSFYVKVFGVKLEAQKHMVTVEQSQSDRSKKPFLPVSVNLPGDKITKVTLGRLHFSETTSNNMRKKGKPNPDQRYIMLVVGLYATVNQDSFLLVAHVSERIIVRASNPGQFESDPDSLWQKGQAPESVVCHGRLGINTDVPDEALVVCGNAKIMGNVMHPSDRRAKENIQEVDPTDQLKRISQMRIVEYDYKPEFASTMGIDHVHETGIIAQEVRELLPSAVKEMGEVNCANGETIDGFLMVDKEQIFMENVGAVKQLCKLTDNLETRIQELEVWNARLSKLKTLGSSRTGSTKGKISKTSKSCTNPNPSKQPGLQSRKNNFRGKYLQCVRHRVFQASIFMLVTTMALCIISITALYLLNLQDDMDFNSSHNNSHLFPTHSTVTADPTSAFTTAARGPPDIDFSEVFYSDHVYCCPGLQNHTLHSMSHSGLRSTPEKRPEDRTHSTDWTDTTVQSIFITQNEQTIAEQYCEEGKCGRGIYSFLIPVSKHLPPNMPITLQMNTNQLLVLHLCWYQENEPCSSALDHSRPKYSARLNTQGHVHRWTVGVASHHHAVYRFRSSVAGLADCSTDLNFAEVLFTDYHFHFYRRCE